MAILIRPSEPEQVLYDLLPDESISSWVNRNDDVNLNVKDDPDPTIDGIPTTRTTKRTLTSERFSLMRITSKGRLGRLDRRRDTLRPLPDAAALSEPDRDYLRQSSLKLPDWISKSDIITMQRAGRPFSLRIVDPLCGLSD